MESKKGNGKDKKRGLFMILIDHFSDDQEPDTNFEEKGRENRWLKLKMVF
jgi:hypothetical protein